MLVWRCGHQTTTTLARNSSAQPVTAVGAVTKCSLAFTMAIYLVPDNSSVLASAAALPLPIISWDRARPSDGRGVVVRIDE